MNHVLFCGKHSQTLWICRNTARNRKLYDIDVNVNALFFGSAEACQEEAERRYIPQGFCLAGYK